MRLRMTEWFGKQSVKELTSTEADKLIASMQAHLDDLRKAASEAAVDPEADDIPF